MNRSDSIVIICCLLLLSDGVLAGSDETGGTGSCKLKSAASSTIGNIKYVASVSDLSIASNKLTVIQAGNSAGGGVVRAIETGQADDSGSKELWKFTDVLQSQLTVSGYDRGREVVTYNPVSEMGIPFRWPVNPAAPLQNELSLFQVKSLLGDYSSHALGIMRLSLGEQLINYWRGQHRYEYEASAEGTNFHKRKRLLMPMSARSLITVAGPQFHYPDRWHQGALENKGEPYSKFKQKYRNRNKMLYLVSDFGFLHGVSIGSGRSSTSSSIPAEKFMFVPSGGYAAIGRWARSLSGNDFEASGNNKISNIGFEKLTESDAFLGDGYWHSILLASGGKLAPGIAAFDVTDPGGLHGGPVAGEKTANRLIRWEYTKKMNPDLGAISGSGVIARLHNGHWGVILGNGYSPSINSTSGSASTHINNNTARPARLIVLDLETGTVVRKITVPSGLLPSVRQMNGLSAPAVVDMDGDFIADFVYAGDLRGNLWKFDLKSKNPKKWGVEFGSTRPTPLFVAKDRDGHRQPIYGRPQVGLFPRASSESSAKKKGPKMMVYFSAGESASTVTTLYAVRDSGRAIRRNGSLLRRQLNVKEGRVYLNSDQNAKTNNTAGSNHDGQSNLVTGGWSLDLPSGMGVKSLVQRRTKLHVLAGKDRSCDESEVGLELLLNAENGQAYNLSDEALAAGKMPGSVQNLVGRLTKVAATEVIQVVDNPLKGSQIVLTTQANGDVLKHVVADPAIRLRRISWRQLED